MAATEVVPMRSSIFNFRDSKLMFFFFHVFLLLLSPCLSDPRISESGLFCGKDRTNITIIPSFVKEMDGISQIITNQSWATHSVNSTPPIFALAQCFEDLVHTDCLLCYAASRTRLPRCLPAMAGRIFLDGCFLRYDNYSFYHESTDSVKDSVNCTSSYGQIVDQNEISNFVKNVGFVVGNVTEVALTNGHFGVKEVDGVYALAQCWETLDRDGCRACLEKAASNVRNCTPNREGRALNAGCYLRYSTVKFYAKDAVGDETGLPWKGFKVTIGLAAAAFLMLSSVAAYAAYRRYSNDKRALISKIKIPMSINKSSLYFKYETLEKATDYFNPSRKIGQGGAGSVYKGTLPDGKIVAVKRLVFNTRQWVDDFFNEVNLIGGIQHQNLVKLLGCSIEGPESLLVYEYVPNRSLDQFIFDKNNVQILNWKQRLNVIVGTAEGLAHLHEGCGERIIHRDIKSSNILLDENLNPKIADFGLARCFSADMTHLSTGIAGTLGYMAPEYLVRGQLTEKADVYSYGVLVLEIVCGKRNNAFLEETGSLLLNVWKLYKLKRLAEAVDPCLGHDFSAKEAEHVLQIGLLCTQAAAGLRPSMAQIFEMLINRERKIGEPSQPPFLNPNTDQTSTVRSYITKLESSYPTTTTSSSHSSDGPSRSGNSSSK